MRHLPKFSLTGRTTRQHNGVALAKFAGRGVPFSKRTRGSRPSVELPFCPPEDWHEPRDEVGRAYRFVIQDPGPGFRHVLTPEDVRHRLRQFPAEAVAALQVVQFSRMTRKKQSFPCYGMQWGTALYLYPIETSLVETYTRPPKPNQVIEATMYGGEWIDEGRGVWKLVWTEEAIRDFYLNNILIHELGHLLDNRNTSYQDRERYAEWFALEYGYKPTRLPHATPQAIVRRHHAKR